jgi:hypothetical protein
MTFGPKPGFDWGHVTWGRPDAVVSALCSYCSASFRDEDVPLMLFKPDGSCAKFCDACQSTWFDMKTFNEEPIDE